MIDPELQQLARRRQNRRFAWVALAAPLIWIVVLVWWASRYADRGEPAPWDDPRWPRLLLFAAVPLVLVGIEIAVLLWLRTRGVGWLQPSPAGGLERGDRRRLLRAVRKGEQLPGRDGELARDMAERLVRQRWVFLLAPVLLVLEAPLIVMHGLDLAGVLVLMGVALLLLALPFGWRDVRCARRYLEEAARQQPDR